MRTSHFFTLTILLISTFCFADDTPYSVSMFELLAVPEKSDGATVRVIGYLHEQSPHFFNLYPYQQDVDLGALSRSIFIDTVSDETIHVDLSPCSEKYVEIVAIFAEAKGRHTGNVLHSVKFVRAYDKKGKYSSCLVSSSRVEESKD